VNNEHGRSAAAATAADRYDCIVFTARRRRRRFSAVSLVVTEA